MKTPHTHPLLQTSYIFAHSITYFVSFLLLPFGIGFIINSTLTSGSQIYAPFRLLPELLVTAIVLHALLKYSAPSELRDTRTFNKTKSGGLVLAMFTILSCILFAAVLFVLIATVIYSIPAVSWLGLSNVLLNISAVALLLGISVHLINHFSSTIVKKSDTRRSFSDWLFDNIETVLRRVKQRPFISR